MVGDTKRVTFITNAPVPFGMATTNRLMSLAKGIVANGHKAKIIIINPTESNSNTLNKKKQGYIDDIEFEYLSKSTIWPRSIILKTFTYVSGLIKIFFKLLVLKQSSRPDIIVIQNMPNIYILSISVLSKLKGILLVQERNEFPYVQNFSNLFRKIDSILGNISLKLFDGMILITNELVLYFRDKVNKKCVLEHILMTVDDERFNIEKPGRPIEEKYLAYAGTMSGDKDGISDLLAAFSIVIKSYPDLVLCLIGDLSNKKEYTKLKEIVKSLHIQDNIVFTGKLERDAIPEYFLNAELLLLARPNNIQAQGGFPTKLGEYLASGIPVIVTKVGEIPRYLVDGENAFLAEPDSPSSFAAKMIEAMSDYKRAKNIGEKGKEVATNVFSYRVQGNNVIGMIDKMSKN